jgi:hypothetical protein
MPARYSDLPKLLRSSPLARFSTLRRSALRFLPARFISKFSMDMADRKGLDLRRLLASDERFSERAMARALLSLKTPDLRSSASLLAITWLDHLEGRLLAVPADCFACGLDLVFADFAFGFIRRRLYVWITGPHKGKARITQQKPDKVALTCQSRLPRAHSQELTTNQFMGPAEVIDQCASNADAMRLIAEVQWPTYPYSQCCKHHTKVATFPPETRE